MGVIGEDAWWVGGNGGGSTACFAFITGLRGSARRGSITGRLWGLSGGLFSAGPIRFRCRLCAGCPIWSRLRMSCCLGSLRCINTGRCEGRGISTSATTSMDPTILLFDHSTKLSYCSKTHDTWFELLLQYELEWWSCSRLSLNQGHWVYQWRCHRQL